MLILAILSIFLIATDQLIKIFISNKLLLNESKTIIKGFFDITNVHNYGAAWSILNNQSILLVVIGIIALVIIYFYFIRNKKLNKIDIILISMLISGIIGNMIDRIRFGYVIDYLDFNIFGYDYPVFNLADSLIVVAMILMLIKSLKEEHNAKIQSRNK